MKNIGSKLRTLRKIHGFKQEYVGNQLGLSQTGYSKIEVGEVEVSITHLQKLAELYKTTPEKLLNTEGMMVSIETVNNNDQGIVVNHGPINHNHDQLNLRLQTLEAKLESVLILLVKQA
jgi:transcriptional regulator with XRE-family HTH domain